MVTPPIDYCEGQHKSCFPGTGRADAQGHARMIAPHCRTNCVTVLWLGVGGLMSEDDERRDLYSVHKSAVKPLFAATVEAHLAEPFAEDQAMMRFHDRLCCLDCFYVCLCAILSLAQLKNLVLSFPAEHSSCRAAAPSRPSGLACSLPYILRNRRNRVRCADCASNIEGSQF